MGLSQVVAHDLLVLLGPRAQAGLQPCGEALVQVGAGGFRQRFVRGVANQQVQELVRRTARLGPMGGTDQLPVAEATQGALQIQDVRRRQQRLQLAGREHLADHRGVHQHGALVRRQAVELRREQGRQGRRGRHAQRRAGQHPAVTVTAQAAFLHQHRDVLLDEQGVAAAGVGDAVARPRDQGCRRPAGSWPGSRCRPAPAVPAAW